MRFAVLVVAVLLCSAAAAAQPPQISTRDGDFLVSGWRFGAEPEGGWGTLFRVYAGRQGQQPMLGSYALKDGALIFHPRFPRAPHLAYEAVFEPNAASRISKIFEPRPAAPPSTSVEQIYPTADVLPGNVLKLYINFSAPMSRGEAWQHIHLLDERGEPVALAFLELEQELWDPEYRRLTVLFDPGRIKRGLVPADELGTPIVEGRAYTLVIDRDWHDAAGIPLKAEFRKSFRGGPVDRVPPSPGLWEVLAPAAGTLDPLIVRFPKPMDYALLQRMIRVRGAEGTTTIGKQESEWRFTPAQPWKPGTYRIEAQSALEDIAGNHLDREFDVDTEKNPIMAQSKSTIDVSFEIY